jgi:SAM-dependent methyltransferase
MIRNSLTTAQVNRLYPSCTNYAYHILHSLRRSLERVFDTYLPAYSGGRLIDYGCQRMPYRPLIEPYISDYTGFDLPDDVAAPGGYKPDAYLTDEGLIPLDDDQVNVVLSTQVLEHVPNPDVYLRESYRVLQDNGLLILTTHGYWKYHPVPEDYWRWTRDGLKRIIENAGFTVVEQRGVVGLAPSSMQLLQDAIVPKLPRWLQSSWIFIMQMVIVGLDRMYSQQERDRDACVYVVVAKKTS